MAEGVLRGKLVKGLDPEVVVLVQRMNALPGIETTGSCCGHGKAPFRVWFEVSPTDVRGLFVLVRSADRRYWEHGHRWTSALPALMAKVTKQLGAKMIRLDRRPDSLIYRFSQPDKRGSTAADFETRDAVAAILTPALKKIAGVAKVSWR